MRTVIVNVVAGVLCLVLMATPTFAADSCGGGCPKTPSNSRFVSATTVPLGDYFASPNVLSATLAKGKSKRVLTAEGLLTDGPYAVLIPRAFVLDISVNGLP